MPRITAIRDTSAIEIAGGGPPEIMEAAFRLFLDWQPGFGTSRLPGFVKTPDTVGTTLQGQAIKHIGHDSRL